MAPLQPASPHRGLGRAVGALIAAALLVAVLWVADPGEVWRLLRATDPGLLAAALATSAAFLALRGLRLQLLLAGRSLGAFTATAVAAAAQAAALFAPFHTGELALPWLLARSTGRDFASGVGTLLAARALDLATLGIWCGGSLLAVRGFGEPLALRLSFLLIAPTALLPLSLAAADRLALRVVAPRGRIGRRWARRVRQVRREIEALRARPARLLGAALVSFAMWGMQWAVAWWLLAAMGQLWSPHVVVAGAAAAAAANLLPVNLVANLGTLEAGWTAAFTALGVPLGLAAATGLAAHLWGLAFAALFGALAWVALSVADRRTVV